MKPIQLTLLFLCFTSVTLAQRNEFNPDLKKRLEAIHAKDRQYRALLIGITPERVDSLAKAFKIKADDVVTHLIKLQSEIDSANITEVRHIFSLFDYPGKSLVGEPANNIAWIIVTHSHRADLYFPRINQAYVKGEIPEYGAAATEDCALIKLTNRQRYGHHISLIPYRDSISGKVLAKAYISPIKWPETVNERRKTKKFPTTIEKYAAGEGAEFIPTISIEQLEQIAASAMKPVKK